MISLFTDVSRDFRSRLFEANRIGVSSSSNITRAQFCSIVGTSKTSTNKPDFVKNVYKTRYVFDNLLFFLFLCYKWVLFQILLGPL